MSAKNIVMTRKAAMTMGAIHGFLKPRLAQDTALPNLTKLLGPVTTKNFAASKPVILKGVTGLVKGKLAKDASVEGLATLLDALESEKAMDDPLPLETEPNGGLPAPALEEDDDPLDAELGGGGGPDADAHAALLDFLKDKISPEDLAEVEKMVSSESADEAPDPLEGLDEKDDDEAEDDLVEDPNKKVAKDDPPPFKGMPKPGGAKDSITKPAMDRAIKAAVDSARKAAADVRDAERFVRPWVGDLTLAHDSAEGVYKTALTALGVDIKGVHPSAYRSILEHVPTPGSKSKAPMGASDEAGGDDFAKRYPEVARVKFA